MPPSKRPTDQRIWLADKYGLYVKHRARKTLGQFFTPFYKEFFILWPLTLIPTAEAIEAAKGNVAIAAARTRKDEEFSLYRWMYNHIRTKHGVSGEESSARLNLTAGPPKKKAAVQTYVKLYWETKVKQEVINKWAPTPETDLFDEADIGEDQISWEELTPMDKVIPLWFRMKIGRELYEAESDEVKQEVDRIREKAKEDAVATRASINMFATDEERLEVMKKYDDNFPKLAHSLGNLCRNIMLEFGFHTSIIVGGPLVREHGRLCTYTFESSGSDRNDLTFSEFLGESYDSEVSEKFIEYLKSCCPKEDRRLYTLTRITTEEVTHAPVSNATVAPAPDPLPTTRTSGPARTTRSSSQARMQTGPLSASLKARLLAAAKKLNTENMPVDLVNASTIQSGSPLAERDISDDSSDTPVLPELLGSAPSAPSDMSVDEVSPAVTTVSSTLCDSMIQVRSNPAPALPSLIQTAPPNLLYADQDERPSWLLTSVQDFLQYGPYYSCLSKVVDLFLAQEARLGYPAKSTRLALPSRNRPTQVSVFMKNARDFTRGDDVNAEKFGKTVVEWWLTIQPTTRKEWPPVYQPLPEDFSFDYFNHGGPNGVFLMILCLMWWANALTPDTDNVKFTSVVHDIHWVLEQIAGRA